MVCGKNFRHVCKKCNWRHTAQRETIYKIICGNRNHPAVEEVWKAAREQLPAISLDTVYRILDEFYRAGICGRFQYGDKMIYDGNAASHGHFFCLNCGRISDFEFPAGLLSNAGSLGKITEEKVGCTGICRECMASGIISAQGDEK